MLAIPEEISSCAKLRSPAADPSGTPSSKIWVPEAPSSTPLPPLSSSALRSSFHVVSNCAAVRTWPNSYKRANFSRIFRLRTNARAEARVSEAMLRERVAAPKVRSEEHTSELHHSQISYAVFCLKKKKKKKLDTPSKNKKKKKKIKHSN